ncbi:hypothetical protein [Citrobacter freundii]|uniref:hypothetical protein n=1 Tax=Citrobacter freundii TaxID=546 RepID=UPI0039C9BF94
MQTTISIQPVLVNRERVQEMLGGISRTTFYRKRKQWEESGNHSLRRWKKSTRRKVALSSAM